MHNGATNWAAPMALYSQTLTKPSPRRRGKACAIRAADLAFVVRPELLVAP